MDCGRLQMGTGPSLSNVLSATRSGVIGNRLD